MEKDPFSNPTDVGDGPVSIYHVYHTNRDDSKNYSIHALSDSHTPINLNPKTTKIVSRTSTSKSDADIPKPQTWWRKLLLASARAKAFDKPGKDPRVENCPYFLQLPTLYGHDPPYALKRGGKKGEVAGLMKPHFAWKSWEIQLGEILKQEGIVDGRGVVNWRYGTKNGEDGTLKGYTERKRRYWGESGKKWFKLQKEIGHTIPEVAEKARPDETVKLRWVHPITRAREYRYTWRGYEFVWKGTGQVASKRRFWRHFHRYQHLKLVVVLPREEKGGVKLSEGNEVLLAIYTSAVSKRKAGRLEVFWDVVEEFLNDHMGDLCRSDNSATISQAQATDVKAEKSTPEQKLNPEEETRERLKDIVMATALCMVIGEFGKRQALLSLFLLMIDIASNAGG
ncbi:hypothetical protein BGZ60DRAFT_386155 [Tricladium varicosporioides]|nr:hypothetical protein BGZ60DRAFT_386155 [Hymenoscyphus varicosporioides]